MPGLLSGRHRGALEAEGEICAFLDDDVRVSQGWLGALLDAFRDADVALVGGPSAPLFETDPPGWLRAFHADGREGRSCGWLSLFDGGKKTRAIDPTYVWGLNFSIRRRTLFDLGGFHPDCLPSCLQRYQGDGETGLGVKVREAGLRALYHPGVSVEHEVPASRLRVEYFEQRARYQGVCDSYAAVRRGRTGAAAKGIERTSGGRLRDLSRRVAANGPLQFTRAMGRGIARLRRSAGVDLRAQSPAVPPDEVLAIRARLERAYRAGYDFHQAEVAGDPALLEWIVRQDYWDYRLPDGWESYTTAAEDWNKAIV